MSREEELIRKHLDEIATPEEAGELERLLVERPEVAALFAQLSRRDGAFRRHFHEERAVSSVAQQIRGPSRRRSRWPWVAAAAAGLLAALLFPVFRQFSRPALASLESAGKGTRVQRADGGESEGTEGMALMSGDCVIAAPGGAARIRVAGEATRFALGAGTELVLTSFPGGRHLNLRKGVVDLTVAPQPPGQPLVVATPHGTIKVIGTWFQVEVGDKGTALDVWEGRVLLTRAADGASLEVDARHSARVSDAKERLRATPNYALYAHRFHSLWESLHDPGNGYFSREGVPYHSAETFLVDAPDYGHLSTSETLSYWLWLEAVYYRLVNDRRPFQRALLMMDKAAIPGDDDQPTNMAYDPGRPAIPVPERPTPSDYPVPPEAVSAPGRDPLAEELRQAHGNPRLHAMHWLIDVDNWYGFGRRDDPVGRMGLINTFQRGREESVWETVPHPSWEAFRSGGPSGYLDLFIHESSYARQWRYTCAPDADARAIQALYVVHAAGETLHNQARLQHMADSLRYAHHDKYFLHPPHYLIGWSFGWGGSVDRKSPWAWRIGSDYAHIGYQNPVTAWVLSTVPGFKPSSLNGTRDWARSLDRQLEFYRWLQSEEGALGGGAKVGGNEFHGLTYDPHPVFLDPPSNEWFGWQAWSMDRLAQYLLLTNDPRARPVCDKWVAWIKKAVKLNADGTYAIPSKLEWTGRPGNLHVRVTEETADVGVTGALARALVYHAAATKDEEAQTIARELLDRIWTLYRDSKGVSNPEARADYKRFYEKVHIPEGWKGPHKPGSTFLDLRPKYRQDPDWPRVEAALARGEAPVFRYHRFWAQVEVALANAEYARLFR